MQHCRLFALFIFRACGFIEIFAISTLYVRKVLDAQVCNTLYAPSGRPKCHRASFLYRKSCKIHLQNPSKKSKHCAIFTCRSLFSWPQFSPKLLVLFSRYHFAIPVLILHACFLPFHFLMSHWRKKIASILKSEIDEKLLEKLRDERSKILQ